MNLSNLGINYTKGGVLLMKEKKDLVSIQDFILNNPQALDEAKDSLGDSVYDWSNAEEVEDVLDSPE
jgi:hypothetical protein